MRDAGYKSPEHHVTRRDERHTITGAYHAGGSDDAGALPFATQATPISRCGLRIQIGILYRKDAGSAK